MRASYYLILILVLFTILCTLLVESKKPTPIQPFRFQLISIQKSWNKAKITIVDSVFSIFGRLWYFKTAEDIPKSYFTEQRSITAQVVKVVDGDTFRVRHGPVAFSGPMSENTIIVRLATVDAPELAKYGYPDQPFARQAKDFVCDKILGKTVKLKLLGLDRYRRVVARTKYQEKNLLLDLSEQLLKNGLAVVYRGKSLHSDEPMSKWNELENDAVKRRVGLWKDGVEGVQTPAQYKDFIRSGALKEEVKRRDSAFQH